VSAPDNGSESPPPLLLPTQEGYDLWAAIYDEEDNPLIALEEAEVVRLLGDLRDLEVADMGCGTGRHAVLMAAEGAKVTALDFSDGMLARARAKPGADRVRFLRHDLTRPLPLESETFDRVTCCLVLDHIADLEGLLREMSRILRPRGFIVVSVMHPALMILGIQARFTDPSTGREVRPAGVPHQVSDYVMASLRAGLTLDHMNEHRVDTGLAERSLRARRYVGWPLLLLMRLRRG
jgi:malonyl-CoA O-methyltransferase